jgi:DeoR/GlpR family transcriptional regulator of sugar metabolism
MRYFEQLRIGWIIETVEIFGFINRSHVVKKFGVTAQVVSSDFNKVQKLHPHLMRYDTSAKCYFLKDTGNDQA